MDAYNVLIIGSGPAGLFAAMQLERMGMDRIVIIDRNPYPAGGLLTTANLTLTIALESIWVNLRLIVIWRNS